MKYTTKSGKELPPEVVEVIEQEQAKQGGYDSDCKDTFGFDWSESSQKFQCWKHIYDDNDLTEFYKIYPKKDYDSYGNEIVKGEMVEVRDSDCQSWKKMEYIALADKTNCKYLVYSTNFDTAQSWVFCRKINSNASKKSELESQMNDLLTKANELKQKINEL